MPASPTSRSLGYCRKMGWTAQVVERYNPHARRRIDLFGVIDLVVLPDDGMTHIIGPEGVFVANGILGIQACAGASHAARRAKAIAEPRLRKWLEAGGRFEVWSWKKYAKAVDRKRWRVRRDPVTLADLEPA